MDLKLDDVLKFDDSMHDDFEKILEQFMPVLLKSDFLVTLQSLMGLMASINSIKLGIYDLAEECDTHLYVVKILQRTLLEQFLRFEYLFQRFMDEGKEEVGVEYRKYSKIAELYAFANASQVAIGMAGKSTDDVVLKELKEKHPELDISKRSLNEISSKWKHRSIIRYLTSREKQSKNVHGFLLSIIPEYAELSSFVHGGTSAEEYYHEIFDSGELKGEMIKVSLNACLLAATVKGHLLIATAKIDSSLEECRDSFMSKLLEFSCKLHNKSMQPTANASAD